MEINSQVNTFIGGMNIDSDITMLADNQYRWAENIRLLTDNAGTTGILQNIEDVRQYEGGIEASENILGTAVTRWYNSTKKIVEECGIVVTMELYEGTYINNVWAITDFNSIKPTWTLVVSAVMNLVNKVAIVTNYESDKVSKIYISDGTSSIKCINISAQYKTDKTNHIEDDTYFDLLPSSTIAPFKFIELTSGNLPAGMIQYCYQLFSVHGGETSTSSLSPMIPISSSNSNSSKTFKGDRQGESTDKGCMLQATLFNDGRFEKIRIISIQYTSNTQTPKIYVINELDLPKSEDNVITFNYNDVGSSYVNELSIEEFNDLVPFEFNAKSIAKMDNRLFASNVQELTWDVDYDARAYRCNSNGIIKLNSSISNQDITTTFQELTSPETDLIIPEEHDCINPMNSSMVYPNNSTDEYAFGYDDNGIIRGGRGLNISYRFIITDLIESDNTPVVDDEGDKFVPYSMSLSSSKKSYNTIKLICPETKELVHTFNSDGKSRIRNYCDPYYVSNFLSHQRDEVYRYGIILYNNKNIPSPVHWIGDIRFPSADVEGYEPFTFGGTVDGSGNYELVSHPLGIMFYVNNLPTDVVAYEIVRCDRTLADRTIVTQGLLNKTIRFNGWYNNTEDYRAEYSLGSIDRRPTIMPTFKEGVAPEFVQGFYNSSKNLFVQQDAQDQNPFDTYGIFDLVTADICFNKEKSDQIVTSGMNIVPLYCAHSATYCNDANNKHYRLGIPFTKVLGKSTNNVQNPFGGPVEYSEHTGNKPSASQGVFDGYEQDGDMVSGGICKYYQFFGKNYAHKDNSNLRQSFPIKDVTKPTNISPYQEAFDAKQIVDYIDRFGFVNYSIGSREALGPHGVCLAISAPDVYSGNYTGIRTTPLLRKYRHNAVLFVNIKKNTTQYGGNTFMSRSYSIYNSTNTYVKTSWEGYDKAMCFGGDTYLGVLDYTHTMLFTRNDPDDRNGFKRYVGAYIPLESSINLYYRNDEHYSQDIVESSGNGQTGEANVYFLTDPGQMNTLYTQKTPMYVYNAAYSNTSTSKNYIQKSIYAEDDVKSMNRITCSELKTNNEQTDSWTKFKFANYLDTDSTYGPVTNLKVFKNKLYFFQDSAVGIASVNDRSLITDNNAGALTLGTGGILTRYDYLVTLNGDSIINDKSITNSETTLYWYDLDKNVICSLSNDFNELSKVKQVQTYLNRLPDNARKNPVSFYDKKYNEVWFRIYDRCLIFNEQLNVFTSFYTHNPNWFFPFSTRLVTIKNNNCYYLHNMYDVNSTTKEEKISYVRFVVNKDIAYTKVFDNQWFSAEFVDIGDETKPTLISDIHFNTKNQETEPIDWKQIEQREDTFRFPISREKQNNPGQQQQTNMSYAGRMRGKYLICNYTLDCNDNREFKLPYVKTTYRYSML